MLRLISFSSLLITGFSLYKMDPKPQNPLYSETPWTIVPIVQQSDPHSKDCQPHEIFRVSDRRCYQMQGE